MISRWIPAILWAGLIFFLSSIPDLKSNFPTTLDLILRKLAHMVEFGILTWLVWRAILSFSWSGIISLLYAISDELHQRFVPGREGTLRDVIIDAIGVIIAILVLRSRSR